MGCPAGSNRRAHCRSSRRRHRTVDGRAGTIPRHAMARKYNAALHAVGSTMVRPERIHTPRNTDPSFRPGCARRRRTVERRTVSKTHPPLSKGELLELLDALAERLRRRRTVARLYVIGDACMALAYGRNRSTTDVDARVETGHSALLEACHEIAHERGLPQNWLNEQATSAIPRKPDRRAQTLYDSPHLRVTGASAEYLLAMKLEAGRGKDIEDISYLLERLTIKTSDEALAIHETLLPDSERRAQARALLSALARHTPELTPPSSTTQSEQTWLAALAKENFPRYECDETGKGLTLTIQSCKDAPPKVLGGRTDVTRARTPRVRPPRLGGPSRKRYQRIHSSGTRTRKRNDTITSTRTPRKGATRSTHHMISPPPSSPSSSSSCGSGSNRAVARARLRTGPSCALRKFDNYDRCATTLG